MVFKYFYLLPTILRESLEIEYLISQIQWVNISFRIAHNEQMMVVQLQTNSTYISGFRTKEINRKNNSVRSKGLLFRFSFGIYTCLNYLNLQCISPIALRWFSIQLDNTQMIISIKDNVYQFQLEY